MCASATESSSHRIAQPLWILINKSKALIRRKIGGKQLCTKAVNLFKWTSVDYIMELMDGRATAAVT